MRNDVIDKQLSSEPRTKKTQTYTTHPILNEMLPQVQDQPKGPHPACFSHHLAITYLDNWLYVFTVFFVNIKEETKALIEKKTVISSKAFRRSVYDFLLGYI